MNFYLVTVDARSFLLVPDPEYATKKAGASPSRPYNVLSLRTADNMHTLDILTEAKAVRALESMRRRTLNPRHDLPYLLTQDVYSQSTKSSAPDGIKSVDLHRRSSIHHVLSLGGAGIGNQLVHTPVYISGMTRPLRPAQGLTQTLRSHHGSIIHARRTVQAREIHSSRINRNIPQWPNPPMPQPSVTPLDPSDPHHSGHRRSRSERTSFWKEWANSASFQAALTTVVGLGMVFGAGVGYLEWYKAHVLHRVSLYYR